MLSNLHSALEQLQTECHMTTCAALSYFGNTFICVRMFISIHVCITSQSFIYFCYLFSWHAIIVDGHSVEELCKALSQPRHQPIAIIAKTIKGKGIPGIFQSSHNSQNSSIFIKTHYCLFMYVHYIAIKTPQWQKIRWDGTARFCPKT